MDVEKTIQFLLDNQARFEATFQAFQVEVRQLGELTARIAQQQLTHTQEFGEFRREITEIVLVLARAQKEASERMDGFDRRLREVAEQGAHTDERLNTLIQIVDGWIRRESNGKPPS